MNTDERIRTALCPDCEMEISVGAAPRPGDRVTCQNCWAALVITSLEPVELNWDDSEEADEDDW
jgi:hypothetical protein